MNKYELLFIIHDQTTDEEKEAIIEKVKSLITSKGGNIDGVDKWGMRKYAYEIGFRSEGYYVLVNFTASSEVNAELTNSINLNEKIVRQMIVRK